MRFFIYLVGVLIFMIFRVVAGRHPYNREFCRMDLLTV